MDDLTKNMYEIAISIVQTLGIIVASIWAYYRFLREGEHQAKIEFDVKCSFFSPQGDDRIVEIEIDTINKGKVEHRFSRISLRVRGITGEETLSRRQDGRLNFRNLILKAELVTEELEYYFVRPGVSQPFRFVTIIPKNAKFILVRAAFKYDKSDDLHTSERVFEIKDADESCLESAVSA